MVRDLTREKFDFSVGRIQVSVDRFISILRELHFDEVSARNKNIEFSSIEDIEENKALIIGNPIITCDGFIISFYNSGVRINAFNAKDGDYEKALSLKIILESKKRFDDKIADNGNTVYFTSIILATGFLLYSFENKIIRLYAYTPYLFVILLTIRLWYIDFYRKSIIFVQRDGWFYRHWSTIASSVITAIIVLLLTAILSPYIDKIP